MTTDFYEADYEDFNGFLHGFGDHYDDPPRWEAYNRKSAAAERRESEARSAFVGIKESTELEAVNTIVIPLLTPSCHLTSASWSDFSKWVRDEHPGWSVKRREATDDEKRDHGETRQSKCYWVDATYKPHENKKRPAVRYDNSISDENIIHSSSSSVKRIKLTHNASSSNPKDSSTSATSSSTDNNTTTTTTTTTTVTVVHDNLVRQSNVEEENQNNEYDEDTDDSILVSGLIVLDYDDSDEEEEVNEQKTSEKAPETVGRTESEGATSATTPAPVASSSTSTSVPNTSSMSSQCASKTSEPSTLSTSSASPCNTSVSQSHTNVNNSIDHASSHVPHSVSDTQSNTVSTCTPSPSGSPTPFVTPGSTSSTPPLASANQNTASNVPLTTAPTDGLATNVATANSSSVAPVTNTQNCMTSGTNHTPATPASMPSYPPATPTSMPSYPPATPASTYPPATPASMPSYPPATPASTYPPATPASSNSASLHTPIASTAVVPGTLIRLHVVRTATTVPLGINIYAPQDPASLAASRVAIASVAVESTADKAGLCVGDVLVTMHGQLVTTAAGPQGLDNAVALFRSLPPSFEVTVLR